MPRRLILPTCLVLLVLCGTAVDAQLPPGGPALPPLLYVRIAGPAGMRVTFYRGAMAGQTLPAPCVVGLRPGYIQRIELSDIPQLPGVKLYPTLEVRGSLLMPPGKAAEHPATLRFTDEDFRSVRADSVVTRVVAVERPETALPVATKPDEPLEFGTLLGRDPVAEAIERGRPLLIARLGQRQASPEELIGKGIPGTVLLPGEKVLPPPRDPPFVPWTCAPVFDPKLGPYPACQEICFYDGGDCGPQVGHNRAGQLVGLDPADTVAEYTDSKGNRRIACSNRVCFCVPRYVVTRGETAPSNAVARLWPGAATTAQVQATLRARATPLEQHQNKHLSALASRVRVSALLLETRALALGQVEGLTVVSIARLTDEVTGVCPKPEEPPPSECLLIDKWPDKCDAQIGEVITIRLRYRNAGGRPITNVVVSDSLTARLEYVPGSATSDRDSVFTTHPNEAGSLVLRWQINSVLPPGQSGTVSFQVRVR